MWILTLALRAAVADEPCVLATAGSPLAVHLVTLTPGDDLFSSMGHTVLVFSGGDLEGPRSYNWGVFDTSQDDLAEKFLLGDLQYYLTAMQLEPFLDFYSHRQLIGQRLALDPDRATALYATVDGRAASKQERAYTYHWATANCATKARDAIDEAVDGALRRATERSVDTTPRFEAMRHFAPWPVLGFAWDFATSDRLDVPLTAWERTMIPEHLMAEVAALEVGGQPLVTDTCRFNDVQSGFAPSTPRATWPFALPGLLLWGVVATRRPRWIGAAAVIYGTTLGILGTSSLFVWRGGGLEGVGPTENWLLAGPQSWVLAWAGAKRFRGEALTSLVSGALWVTGALGVAAVGINALPFLHQANGPIVWALLPGLLACVVGLTRSGLGQTLSKN